MIKMNLFQEKKFYLLIKNRWLNKLYFIYFPLGKAFVKQTKKIEDQGKQQVDALKTLKSK